MFAIGSATGGYNDLIKTTLENDELRRKNKSVHLLEITDQFYILFSFVVPIFPKLSVFYTIFIRIRFLTPGEQYPW